MSDAEALKARPKILLVTDLSSRSDRALDRATFLAKQWDAELVVFHVLQPDRVSAMDARALDAPSWRRPPDAAVAAEKRIRRDLRAEGVDLRIIIGEGETVTAVLSVVEQEACDLIVLGPARDETLGHILLGNTVDHLVRRSPVSVLVVKSRANGPYRHIVVGTDFTDESRHGLQIAVRAFPEAIFTLLHAFELPYRTLAPDTKLGREFNSEEAAAMRTFLEEAGLAPEAKTRVHPIIEYGPPEQMFRNYVEERSADLIVIGAFGRGLMFHLLIGGNAPRIVDATPSDVLVVRAPKLVPKGQGDS